MHDVGDLRHGGAVHRIGKIDLRLHDIAQAQMQAQHVVDRMQLVDALRRQCALAGRQLNARDELETAIQCMAGLQQVVLPGILLRRCQKLLEHLQQRVQYFIQGALRRLQRHRRYAEQTGIQVPRQVVTALRQQAFHDARQVRGQRQEQQHAGADEQRMEGGQAQGARREARMPLQQPDRPGQRRHQGDGDEPRHQVEKDMRRRRALGVNGAADGDQRPGQGGADGGADDHRRRLVEIDGLRVQRRQGGGDGGGGRLQQGGHDHADQHDHDARPQPAGRQPGQAEFARQRAHGVLQGAKAQEQQAESRQRHAQFAPASARQQLHEGADADQRQGIKAQVDFQAQPGDDPAGGGISQAGADHHADGLGKGDEPGADETDQRDRGGGGRLRQGRDQRSGNESLEGRAGKTHQRLLQRAAGKRHQAAGQQHHADQEEADATEQRDGDA